GVVGEPDEAGSPADQLGQPEMLEGDDHVTQQRVREQVGGRDEGRRDQQVRPEHLAAATLRRGDHAAFGPPHRRRLGDHHGYLALLSAEVITASASAAADFGSAPVSTLVRNSLIGLRASTAVQFGEFGVAWPLTAPIAIAAAPGSACTASASEVRFGT